jgi:DNA-3-methyladenine glycosylase I
VHYCDYAPHDPLHAPYHDREHGFPATDETVLFERLILEITQAGLSWGTVLRKRATLRAAYAGFAVDRVAAFGQAERARLLADPGIVRNARKVDAAIANAHAVQQLRGAYGSFAAFLDVHHPRSKPQWVKLLKRHFAHVGGEIAGEFLMSLGYLPGAHRPDCPAFERVRAADPPWCRAPGGSFDRRSIPPGGKTNEPPTP